MVLLSMPCAGGCVKLGATCHALETVTGPMRSHTTLAGKCQHAEAWEYALAVTRSQQHVRNCVGACVCVCACTLHRSRA